MKSHTQLNIDLVERFTRLQKVPRLTRLADLSNELVSTHSLSLTALVYEFCRKFEFSTQDTLDAVVLAMYHDLPEGDPECGDTPTLLPLSEQELLLKQQRETFAYQRLSRDLAGLTGITLQEHRVSPKVAYLVDSLDKCIPGILHLVGDFSLLYQNGLRPLDLWKKYWNTLEKLLRTHYPETYQDSWMYYVQRRIHTGTFPLPELEKFTFEVMDQLTTEYSSYWRRASDEEIFNAY